MSHFSNLDQFIIRELLSNVNFCSKYIDKLEPDFFKDYSSYLIRCIKKYFSLYSKSPSVSILTKNLIPKLLKDDKQKIEATEDYLQQCINLQMSDNDEKWLEDEVKNFIKVNKIKKALLQSVEYLEKGDADSVAALVLKASEINFDEDLGIDYVEDIEKRLAEYKQDTSIISTGHKILDDAIGGGWRPKSLIVIGAPTNGGKTLILGHITFKLMEMGFNGLYITLEINQNILASRIDSNFTDISTRDYLFRLEDVQKIIHQKIKEREQQSKSDPTVKPYGRLIIKEACPNVFTANDLNTLLKNLKLKKNFIPDYICIDYLGLMVPNSRSASDSTYVRLRTVSEEIRQIAMTYNIPIFSAVQINREGYNTTSVGLEKIADSIGVAYTVDLAILVSKDPEDDKKMIWNIAKSRWSKNGNYLEVSVDYDHMRIITEEELTNAQLNAQQEYLDDFSKFIKDGGDIV